MPRILAPFDESLANVAKDHLISKGVDVRTGTAVTYVESQDVTLAPSTPRSATPEQKAAAAAAAQSEEMGALVWAAGIGARPLVKKLAASLGQKDMRGLIVDENLKVKGTDGVYAIGDAALSGFAPTAQVAAQQGKHIGRAIRDGEDSKFEYNHAGSLCCLGSDNGKFYSIVARPCHSNDKIINVSNITQSLKIPIKRNCPIACSCWFNIIQCLGCLGCTSCWQEWR